MPSKDQVLDAVAVAMYKGFLAGKHLAAYVLYQIRRP